MYNDSFINTIFIKALSQYSMTMVGFIPLTSEDFGIKFLCGLQCYINFFNPFLKWWNISVAANMFPTARFVLSLPTTKSDKMYCIEWKTAKAIWKKAEVLFFQFCRQWMVIVVTVVSLRPQFPSLVLVLSSSEDQSGKDESEVRSSDALRSFPAKTELEEQENQIPSVNVLSWRPIITDDFTWIPQAPSWFATWNRK